ncbi:MULTISPECIES: helix-turn-helix transcriptional regulator [unclassified Streptomyces]|uniref:helix-turn-helix transcriptional regulator n=1 Tax=unclassified Streptomyces TaxID=2593676 RepID=UPI000AD85E92|nr:MULTISPECIES: LuxR C-terminal-related transcriptional regulator [unclassified Streptomyces]MCX5150218.1 LuxR C-terminal-related transcriptional regulator [Streptomyces sp. NBC_00320]WSN48087.1 LuxR C-terminal-related transcriptional regulator [Streptomyces sp. NBC_01296]WSW62500.1 LuxR C-terminal-related transcriptional regulator [Streptomyces sp. NBC_00998]
MGVPVPVDVIAFDPVLEAGTKSTLFACPELCLTAPGGAPRVVVMTVDQVGRPELDVLRTVRDAPARPDVVLVAGELAPDGALHAIAAGARGLLRRREADVNRLSRAVLAASRGDCTLPPDLLDRLLERSGAGGRAGSGSDGGTDPWAAAGLSDRERSVLRLVADGHETNEIAKQLCYSPRTVTSVVHDITQRFRLRNRAHAVAYALRVGLL